MKASVLMEMRKDDDVIKITDELVGYHPHVADGWYLRGIAFINTDKPEYGLRSLKRALEIEPRHTAAQEAIDHLFKTHPNNLQYVLAELKRPVKKTYQLVYDILKGVDTNEWLCFRIVEIAIEGFTENAIKKEFDMEFKQIDFKKHLPVVIFRILLQEGYFLLYVGKLDSPSKKILLFGLLDDLYGEEMLLVSSSNEKTIEPSPLYKSVKENYAEIQEQWQAIWNNEMKLPLGMFFNLELLEKYLEQLQTELS